MAVKTYGSLCLSEGEWRITAQPHVAMRLKRVFPRVRVTAAGEISIRDTAEVARDIEWMLMRWPLDIDDHATAYLRKQADWHRASERAVQDILAGKPREGDWIEPARPAREYQVQAADIVNATGRLLLTDDVGLGKSMSGLMTLRDPATLPALVVTLTPIPKQWLGELTKTFPWMVGHILTNGTVYDPTDRCNGHTPDVIITSYSKLWKWQHHLAGRVRAVIFDEIQELRHSDSGRYQAAQHIASQAEYRVGLTATPVFNYAGELYNIINVLAPDSLGSRDEFMREWGGVAQGQGSNVRVRDANALGAYLRDQGLMLRRTRKDVGRELPEPVVVEQPVATDHQIVDDAIRDVSEVARLLVSSEGDRQARMMAASELDWRMRQATGVAKARYVADFVRLLLESEERVVLYGWHRDVYDIWQARLRDFNPVMYTGSESANQKQESVQQFLHGDARVLILSLRSGAGLDGLQEGCSVAVFGELDWSPAIHEQCIGRLWRDGLTGQVVAYYLVSEAGTDPLMTEVLGLKTREQNAVRGDAQLFNTQVDTTNRVQKLAAAVLEGKAG